MGGDIGEIQLGSERELYKYINHYAVGGGDSFLFVYFIFYLYWYSYIRSIFCL